MGEDGFGPSKLKSNRFTVCPLWPLGNSPIRDKRCIEENGAGGRTRTPDLLITNQLLYQLSYTSANIFIISHLFAFVKCFFEIFQNFFDSSESEITLILVEATGLEPAASWSQTKHSTKLSYASNSTSGLVRVRQLLYYSKAKAFCQAQKYTFVHLHKIGVAYYGTSSKCNKI